MEIRQLKHFLAIVEARSFTKAAQRVHLSQPAISASIANLEAELGKPLFVRAKRQVTLTPEGKDLLKSAKLIVAEYRELKQRFNADKSAAVLKILNSHTFPINAATQVLNALQTTLPNVTFSVNDFVMDESGTGITESGCDLALTVTNKHAQNIKGYSNLLLHQEAYGILVPSAHPFAQMQSISLKDITREPFIARLSCEYQSQILQKLRAEKIWLNVKHKTDQDARAVAMVEAEIGLTLAPESMRTTRTHFIPFSDTDMQRNLYVYLSDSCQKLFADNELQIEQIKDWFEGSFSVSV